MANVQPEHGYTKIADEILEQMARIKLSPTQYRILFVVWRYTYGFNRKQHELSLSFIQQATELDIRNIRRELKDLEERKIIFQKVSGGQARVIQFNKDYEQWVGETAHGRNHPRAIMPKGDNTQGTMGETAHGGMGETAQEEIHSLQTTLNTEEEEASLPDSEIMKRSYEIEKHYCKHRGIMDASSSDFHEIKILVAAKIPVEFIKASIDRSFKEFQPKYERDEIRTFSYCSVAAYERWAKHLEKVKPFPKGGQADVEKHKGFANASGSGLNARESAKVPGESKIYPGRWDDTSIQM
ncbi:replication protein [Paenibacillus sp. HJGM_3]|uniref:replication protein n=1 Tax=Paenibacillus sp. HJGM_3 TaxID=3379816 RepID=UPI00385B52F5